MKFRVFFYIITMLMISFSVFGQNRKYSKIYDEIQYAREINPDSALVIANNYSAKIKDTHFQASIFIYKAMIYSALGEREKAIDMGNNACEFAKNTSDNELISRSYGVLCNMLRNASLFEESNKKLKEGLTYAIRAATSKENKWIETSFYREYSQNLSHQSKIDSAIYYSHRALFQILKFKNPNEKDVTNKYLIYNDLGEYFLQKNSLDSAQFYLQKVLNNKEENYETKNLLTINVNCLLSKVYYKEGKYKEAIELLKKIEPAIPENMLIFKAEYYVNLAKNYEAIDDLVNFKKYNDLYSSIRDKLDEEDTKSINKLLNYYDKQHKEIEQKNRQKQLVATTICIVLLFVIGMLFFNYHNERKKREYYYQKYKKALEKRISKKEIEKEKHEKSSISVPEIAEETERYVLSKLKKFETSEKYLSKNISLPSLASDFKTNTKYLSQIIKNSTGHSFNTYINTLRIDYISDKILNYETFQKYKISYLAEHSGFSSADTFSKIFKEIVGISPSVFVEESKQEIRRKNKKARN